MQTAKSILLIAVAVIGLAVIGIAVDWRTNSWCPGWLVIVGFIISPLLLEMAFDQAGYAIFITAPLGVASLLVYGIAMAILGLYV